MSVAGNGGQCCGCDELGFGCDCGLPCSLECQQKNSVALGQACLCGLPEYTDPSSPVKRYRTESLTGNTPYCTYGGNSCAHPLGGGAFGYDGSYKYDVDSCAITNTLTVSTYFTADGAGCGSTPIFSSSQLWTGPDDGPQHPDQATITTTQTQKKWEFAADPANPCAAAGTFSGTVTTDLSDEDTDDDALARSIGEGDWNECDDCGTGCSSFRTVRTGSETCFDFRAARVRVHFAATIGADYTVKVSFGDRTLGASGPFIPSGTTTLLVTATDIGEVTDWIAVPCHSGVETIPIGCSVTPS